MNTKTAKLASIFTRNGQAFMKMPEVDPPSQSQLASTQRIGKQIVTRYSGFGKKLLVFFFVVFTEHLLFRNKNRTSASKN